MPGQSYWQREIYSMSRIKNLFYHILPFWKKQVLIACLGITSIFLSLANPYLVKIIIDKAYTDKDLRLFIILIIAGGVIFTLSELLNGSSNYFDRYIKLHLEININKKIFRKLQSLPYAFFQDTSTGEHLYKISYDVEQFSRFMAHILPQAALLMSRTLFIFIIMFSLNRDIALLSLAAAPFLCIMQFYFNNRLKRAFRLWLENSQHIFKKLQETLSHMQLIKAFGKEKQEARQYAISLRENMKHGLNSAKIEITSLFTSSLTGRIFMGLILFYGGFQIIKGQITLGSLSAITIYLVQLSGIQNFLIYYFQQITLGMVSYERIEKILQAKAEQPEDNHARNIIMPKGRIEFRDIAFGYGNRGRVLDGLNFIIKGASCIGLAGHSGVGKSTIINLLLRLFRPHSGEILIDGNSISTIRSQSLYGQIGIVLQEPYLWNDTIENNIRYSNTKAGFKDMEEASDIACISDFINMLEKGYDTVIGENACKISEGQKQRIAIARALMKKPRILILDETLSSVDIQIERNIIENIRKKLKDTTIIIISHRLLAIRSLDLVYFLKGPKNIDIDIHENLIKDNADYRRYIKCQ
jgi:ABC-type bacteriocin/lantibiotic exporter with double-glycine peptidase domain